MNFKEKCYYILKPFTNKKVKELLESGEITITEASFAINIDDICYFHKLFKKFYGKAPGTFLAHSI